jgi:hypothetical protein
MLTFCEVKKLHLYRPIIIFYPVIFQSNTRLQTGNVQFFPDIFCFANCRTDIYFTICFQVSLQKFFMQKLFFYILILFAMSCNGKPNEKETEKQQHPVPGNNAVDKIIISYLELKDAFISTDSAKINQAGLNLLQAAHLDTAKLGDLVVTDKNALLENARKLESVTGLLTAAASLPEKLGVFKDLTEWMKKIAVLSKTQTLYVQNCPMAGAYSKDENVFWLSAEEKIKNPFFPKNMLTCGLVVDTLVNNK